MASIPGSEHQHHRVSTRPAAVTHDPERHEGCAEGAFEDHKRQAGPHQQREGAGRSDRRTAPLDEARYEQRRDIRSKTARHGRESEDHKAQTEQSQSSVKVAGAPACKEEPSKGQCVEARHPIEVGGRDVKRPLHARQGHIDDGVVKHQHQLRRRDDKQC
jgi:hypothetical protein